MFFNARSSTHIRVDTRHCRLGERENASLEEGESGKATQDALV